MTSRPPFYKVTVGTVWSTAENGILLDRLVREAIELGATYDQIKITAHEEAPRAGDDET